ncbi:hypothetical protein [Nocardia salmonicida]|uniref:hypothetical protein n=1 Tax=Nocardia salmonicida TaxID=53431 RepID=UPI002E2D80AD|nr:hypothetical protein [Nocardia salmonicida]
MNALGNTNQPTAEEMARALAAAQEAAQALQAYEAAGETQPTAEEVARAYAAAEEATRLLEAAAAASGHPSSNRTITKVIAKTIATTAIGRFLIEAFDYLNEHEWFGLLG